MAAKTMEDYHPDQRKLAKRARTLMLQVSADLGTKLAPRIVKPGENPHSPQAILGRGEMAMSAWRNAIRSAITATIEGVKVESPLAHAMVCAMVLGEMCAVADHVGEEVHADVEETMSDVFEGGYILGRLAMSGAIENGKVTVERKDDGTTEVKVKGPGKIIH